MFRCDKVFFLRSFVFTAKFDLVTLKIILIKLEKTSLSGLKIDTLQSGIRNLPFLAATGGRFYFIW